MDEATAKPRARPVPTDDVFRAMADATRQKLLQLLILEELNVSELVAILRQPQSTISRHLHVLRGADLVRDRRDRNTTLYRASLPSDATGDLPGLLHGWLKSRRLATALQNRLHKILRERSDESVGFFDRLGKRWDELRAAAFGEAFATEAFISLLPADWTVLDIGAGTGYLLPSLADHFRQVIAVEPASAMLECARQRILEHGVANVVFHHGDLGHLPISDQTCDLAIACLVLHHLPSPAEAVAEIHRVLRPGGRLLIVEQEAHENQEFYETMQDHWWGFDPVEFAEQVSAAGFAAVRQHPLATARPTSGSAESPRLFVVTASRAEGAS
jgi:SAM-dependent methyltransferase